MSHEYGYSFDRELDAENRARVVEVFRSLDWVSHISEDEFGYRVTFSEELTSDGAWPDAYLHFHVDRLVFATEHYPQGKYSHMLPEFVQALCAAGFNPTEYELCSTPAEQANNR